MPEAPILLALTTLLLLALGCGSGSPTRDAPLGPADRISVEPTADGGFTTLLRGTSPKLFDGPRDVAVDREGNLVVVGGTQSPDFPTTPGAYQTAYATGGTQLGDFGEMDVFVVKLRPDGTVSWSTLVGGPNYDRAYAVEIGKDGTILVAGRAGADFPTTPGVVQSEFAGDDAAGAYGPQDGFVFALSPDGAKLLWSTYLGDPGPTIIRDLAVDTEGNPVAALVGRGSFSHVPPDAYQAAPGGSDDDVLVKLHPQATRVLWATYLGRDGKEGNPSVRVREDGRIFLLTSTDSDGWVPPGAGFQSQRAGESDWLLLRLSPDGWVEASTYVGGSDAEATETHHLALDSLGRPHLGAGTRSYDLPIPSDTAFHTTHGSGQYDGYTAVLSADLDELVAATYIGHGGPRGGGIEGLDVNRDGVVFVGGATGGDVATTPDAAQPLFGGHVDAYVGKLSPDLERALYLSYAGGPGDEIQRSLVSDGDDIISVGQASGDVSVRRFVAR